MTRTRDFALVAFAASLASISTGSTARAQPAVDVADLPPLPPASDEKLSKATMFAASEAEEDVVVGAAKREQSLGSVASAVTVVSGDRLRRFGYRTIGEAVAAVAGAYLVDNRLSYSIGIRGLQIPGDFNTRILVLVDGASINEAWGAFAGLGFDAIVGIDEVARIEVIRGPVSSVYGTNAFFGIINIITRGAAETPRAWGRAGYNSINGVISSAGFATGGVDRQLRGSVSFMNRIGEDITALDGTRTPASSDGSQSYTVGLVGAYGGTFGQIRAFRFNRESPFAPYDVNPINTPYNQIDRQLLIEGGHTHAFSDRMSVAGRAYASLYEFSDDSPPFDPIVDNPLDTTGSARTIGAELRGRYELVVPDRLGVTVGGELSNNHTRSTAFESPTPNDLITDDPNRFNLGGVYTELDGQPLPWLGFTAGVRADVHSELEDRISPRAALFVSKPEAYGAKLLYAEGFRNPSAFEAFFEDGSDFIAHPELLKAETIRSFEVVGWLKRAGLSARLSAFYWDAADIIEAQPAPEDPAFAQFQNVTRYVSRGLEAEASYRNSRGWYAFGGGAFTDVGTENASGDLIYGIVTNAPKVTAGAGVSTPKLGKLAYLSLEGILIGPRPSRADIDGNSSPDSPTWVGLNFTLYAPKIRYGFDLTAGVRNLIGTRDRIPTPPDYDKSQPDDLVVPLVLGEGREFFVKVGYSY